MIFDVNVPYSQQSPSSNNLPVSFLERAEKSAVYLLSIPGNIFYTIAAIGKLAFLAIGAAFTLGLSKAMNHAFMQEFKKILFFPLAVSLAFIGVFAPVNAEKWEDTLGSLYAIL